MKPQVSHTNTSSQPVPLRALVNTLKYIFHSYNINAVLFHVGRFADILSLLLEDATPTGRDHIRYAQYPRFLSEPNASHFCSSGTR